MKLLDYMKSNGITDDAFASLCGGRSTPRAVRKWKYGETHPRIPELIRIAEITSGEVTALDFIAERSPPSVSRERQGILGLYRKNSIIVTVEWDGEKRFELRETTTFISHNHEDRERIFSALMAAISNISGYRLNIHNRSILTEAETEKCSVEATT